MFMLFCSKLFLDRWCFDVLLKNHVFGRHMAKRKKEIGPTRAAKKTAVKKPPAAVKKAAAKKAVAKKRRPEKPRVQAPLEC